METPPLEQLAQTDRNNRPIEPRPSLLKALGGVSPYFAAFAVFQVGLWFCTVNMFAFLDTANRRLCGQNKTEIEQFYSAAGKIPIAGEINDITRTGRQAAYATDEWLRKYLLK